MYHRENHQPGSLPCGHVTVWYVTYFTGRDKKVLKPPSTAVFAYGKYLTTAVNSLQQMLLQHGKECQIKDRRDYGVIRALGRFPEGEDL